MIAVILLVLVLWGCPSHVTAATHEEVQTLKNELAELKTMYQDLANQLSLLQTSSSGAPSGGAIYVRWGRKTCPSSAELVYKGQAAGGWWADSGAGADTLCLPSEPQYANFSDALEESSLVYGTEYETEGRLPGFNNQDQDVPCVVCRNPNKSAILMCPARTSCYHGFQAEYTGYLVSNYRDNDHGQDFICMDSEPENMYGGVSDGNGHLLYFVEGRCDKGALRCPPYHSGRELACVVCSK